MLPTEILSQYDELVVGAGMASLGASTQIELRGADRATFLHNLCTNEIRKLPSGSGCEAFLTNVQGKVLAHAHVWAGSESLIVETVPGLGEKLMRHLDRYLIREQVELIDRSQEWTELLLAGARIGTVLRQLGCELPSLSGSLQHCNATIGGRPVSLRRVTITLPECYLLSCANEHLGDVQAALKSAGVVPCERAALEMARVEAGFPWYGVDITEDNLAPEVGRDKQAISYVKGCYLGQETIARIDALGHVNRLLVGVVSEGPDVPPPGSELLAGDKVVGQVTSAVFSPRLQTPLALAYVRRGHNAPGDVLTSMYGPVTVVKLPLESP
jgi:folate-binding protein YgfZ